MNRFYRLATALALPALLSGCAEDVVGLDDCADVVGNRFLATDFGFTSALNPAVVRDFDDLGVTFEIGFDDDEFTSRFVAPGATPLVRTGGFTLVGNTLALGTQPLFVGAAPVEQRFICDVNGGVLRLRSEGIDFDFDNDGVFDDAVFEAELGLL